MVFFVFLVTTANVCRSQQIKGIETDELKNGVAHATVGLLGNKYSKVLKFAVAAADGGFVVMAQSPGSYGFKITATGFKDLYTEVFSLGGRC